jgi:hypothetical protein
LHSDHVAIGLTRLAVDPRAVRPDEEGGGRGDVLWAWQAARAGFIFEYYGDRRWVKRFSFSLSHFVPPFPVSDSLYGLDPDPSEDYDIRLGTTAPRGERGALIVSLDTLLRMSSNRFFLPLVGRIEEGIRDRSGIIR